MRFRFLAVPFLIAASPTPPAQQSLVEPLPVVLAPYVHDGAFEAGDFHWLRGQFDGATAIDKANDAAIVSWRQRCFASDLAQTRSDLVAIGVNAGSSLDTIPYRTLICNQVATLPEPLNRHDWDGFARDVTTVRPVAQGFFAALKFAESASSARSTTLADLLVARVVGDQIVRQGLNWASGGASDAPALSLTPQQSGILVAEIAMAMAARDRANTEWLKGIVALQGWPTRTKVGDGAAGAAWLLVQHADADPAFQTRVLRLMEPLVKTGEVNKKNFAYLYDRVMLKLVGKQRYATQMTCHEGRYVPLPVEDERKIDMLRHEVGLDPLAQYQKQMIKDMGSCSEAPNEQ